MRSLWVKRIGARSRIPAAAKKNTLTRTSKRALAAGLATLILAGCDGMPAFSFAPPDVEPEEMAPAPREVTLTSGMTIRAPFGKCVDTSRTRQGGASATFVMANCSNLGGAPEDGTDNPGLIFVTVMAGQHGDLGALRAQVSANPGLLARSGQAADVDLLSVETSRAALYANLVDRSRGGPQGTGDQHWKAALDVAGRAVVISVFGEPDGPIAGAAGERLARDAAQTLLDANRGLSLPPVQETGIRIESDIETAGQSAENTPQNVLQRVFQRR